MDLNKRQDIRDFVKRQYSLELQHGRIILYEVGSELYPPLTDLKQNYKDEPRRVSWRSKQVVDFAYMFYLAQNLSEYYIQIEDDVFTTKDFVSKIQTFITDQTSPWVTLQFSELGFIGKLYASHNLDLLARFFLLFYQEMPVDWLYIYFARLLSYPVMPLRKPTLFQHVGQYSSLTLSKNQKLNNLKDKFFDGEKQPETAPLGNPILTCTNPSAQIYTSLEPHQKKYAPEMAYNAYKSTFFWGKNPVVNDTYLVVFHSVQRVQKIFVGTGHPSHTNDWLREGVLEVSPRVNQFSRSGLPICDSWETIGKFEEGRVEVDLIGENKTLSVACLRVRITQDQFEWVILHQISICHDYRTILPDILVVVIIMVFLLIIVYSVLHTMYSANSSYSYQRTYPPVRRL